MLVHGMAALPLRALRPWRCGCVFSASRSSVTVVVLLVVVFVVVVVVVVVVVAEGAVVVGR